MATTMADTTQNGRGSRSRLGRSCRFHAQPLRTELTRAPENQLIRLAQVEVRLSAPTQMVSTTSVVANAVTAAIANQPKRTPSLPRALPLSGLLCRLDTRAIDVLG